MFLQILIATLCGVAAGTFTGLSPGIHINLIGAILVAQSSSLFSSVNPLYLVAFIVAMAITHTFTDFIPSIFLGCPDTDTELSILPGHELLKQGQGYEAVMLTNYGSILAVFVLILIAFPSIFIISKAYNFIKIFIPYLLILISIFLILFGNKRKESLFAFLLTGFLGYCVLNMEMKDPLLPLLTGLFGSSMLLISIKMKTQIPKQEIKKKIKINFLKPLLGATFASPLCGFLPGLGSGQAAIIGNQIAKTDRRGFLVLIGATNTLVMGFSFISLYVISKTRTGAAAAIKELMPFMQKETFILILIVMLVSGIISFFVTTALAKFFSTKMEKVNYSFLSKIVLVFLTGIILIFSGFLGLLVFVASTFTGIYCISLGVRRTNLMGCLLIPTIILYLF